LYFKEEGGFFLQRFRFACAVVVDAAFARVYTARLLRRSLMADLSS
jgi:hypothetical protein